MKKLVMVVLSALMAMLLGGALFVRSVMDRPLGPPLELTGALAVAQPDAQPVAQQSSQVSARQPDKTCGASGQVEIQVIGLTVELAHPYDADLIRLVHLDFDDPTVTVLALPRTVWVEAAALNDPEEPETFLGRVYKLAKEAAHGEPAKVRHEKATRVMAQTVLDDFGYAADHYLTVDPNPFKDMVDTLGGIDIELSQSIESADDEIAFFPAGPQHLNGHRTLDLARILAPVGGAEIGEWARFARQNGVLQALLATLRQPANWLKAPELAKDFRQVVTTDMSINDLRSLLCMVENYGAEANLVELPKELLVPDADGHLVPDGDKVRDWIAEYTLKP